MRRFTAALVSVLAAGALAGCTHVPNPFAASALDEALSMLPGGDGLTGMSFVDYRGIREVTKVEVVPTGTRLDSATTDAERWGVAFILQTSPMTPDNKPLLASTAGDWVMHGAQSTVVKAPKSMVTDVQSRLGSMEGTRFDGDLILIERGDDVGHTGRQVDKPLSEVSEVKALRGCLEGAHVASVVGAVMDSKRPFATASRVDAEGAGHAWACVLAGADAESYAKSVRDQGLPEVGGVTVKGDVVRVEMLIKDSGGAVPDAATYGQRAVLTFSPGF